MQDPTIFYIKINNLWDIFRLNEKAIQLDFELLTKGRQSQPISHTNQVLGRENIFLNGAILGMNQLEIKRKLDDIIAKLGPLMQPSRLAFYEGLTRSDCDDLLDTR